MIIFEPLDKKFPKILLRGAEISSKIKGYKIEGLKGAVVSYSGNSASHLKKLKDAGFFALSPEKNTPADVFQNSGVTREAWFLPENDTNALFAREQVRHSDKRLIISSNAGNAPLHDWEVNYAEDQAAPLAAKDFSVSGRPMTEREYFAVSYGPNAGINIGYEHFTDEGKPQDKSKTVIVGGRPLVHNGLAVEPAKVLETSITDPRHVIMMPEVHMGGNDYMPLGIRTIQRRIRAGQSEEIIRQVRGGEFILISLAEERACYPLLDQAKIVAALSLFGYEAEKDYELKPDTLTLKFRFNSYRHTFWAKKDDILYIGIINNDLPENSANPGSSPRFPELLYKRILKPIGLTIPQLQEYLTVDLKVSEAVLMGNGKDPRIYLSQSPHAKEDITKSYDNDVDVERSAITAGMLTLAI